MKKYLIFGIAAGMLLFFSCKNHKTEAENTTSSNSEEKMDGSSMRTDTVKMLNVSFISIGEGVDFQAAGNFKTYMDGAAFAEKLAMEEYRWGREGEIDYCMDFGKLNTEEKSNVLNKIDELMASSKLMRLEYNMPCRNKRQ